MKTVNLHPLLDTLVRSHKQLSYRVSSLRNLETLRKMSTNNFPPDQVKGIVNEVAKLLKERKESVSVAETVCCLFSFYLQNRRSFIWLVEPGVLWLVASHCLSPLIDSLLTYTENAGSRRNHFCLSPLHTRSKRILQRRLDCTFLFPPSSSSSQPNNVPFSFTHWNHALHSVCPFPPPSTFFALLW